MVNVERLKQRIENILSNFPDDLKIELQFCNGSAEFNITEKPVGFSLEDEQILMSKFNSLNKEIA